MCHFFTVAVHEDDAAGLQSTVPRGFALTPVFNRFVSASLHDDFVTFVFTSGGCSCGFYQPEPTDDDPSGDVERLRRKYAKKGWPRAKIDRALEQSVAAHSEPERKGGFREDVVSVLSEFAHRVSRFALLIHWYHGGIDDERITFGASRCIDAAQLADVVPEEDCWMWIAGQ